MFPKVLTALLATVGLAVPPMTSEAPIIRGPSISARERERFRAAHPDLIRKALPVVPTRQLRRQHARLREKGRGLTTG